MQNEPNCCPNVSYVTNYQPDLSYRRWAGHTSVTYIHRQAPEYSAYTSMQLSDQSKRRKDIRYAVSLPVAIRLGKAQMSARSENLSLGGILLSSDFLIPEGSTVELAVGVAKMPDHDLFLTACGKVLRVQPQGSGKFAMAVACEHPFRITPRDPKAIFNNEA